MARTLNEEVVLQIPAPLPFISGEDVMTEDQWKVFAAVADTIVQPVAPLERTLSPSPHALTSRTWKSATDAVKESLCQRSVDGTLVEEYLAETATSSPAFKDGIRRLLACYLGDDKRNGLLFILRALNTRAGALLLTGYTRPLYELDIAARQRILISWATARIPLFRTLYRDLSALSKMYWLRTSPTLGRLLSYPRTPVNHKSGTGFPFSFLQLPPPTISPSRSPEILETDVLIIGSGCCGAVAASVLAKAGLSVIVADKSYYWPPEHLPMSENAAAINLFANGGITLSDSGAVGMVSGSCWGGGGTVNWSACLQLQGFVRSEWAASPHNLPYFTSAAFQADMDAVCERMGVGTAAVEHNFSNAKLLEGARRLGMNGKSVPQNSGGKAHNCGYCTLGCGSCGKKGPTETWLPDAARAGAQFIEGFECHEVLFSQDLSVGKEKVATGVRGTWKSRDLNAGTARSNLYTRQVEIKARRAVIVAAGALSTPVVLQASGLRNPHIGRHLHVHPVSFLGGVFDQVVNPWEGDILTAVVNDHENLDGKGHGVKLEATAMLPGFWLPLFPWKGGAEWKAFCAKMGRMCGYISLARDEGEGRVFRDKSGRGTIIYDVKKEDQGRIAKGVETLVKIMYVAGAREVMVPVQGVEAFVRRNEEGGEGVNEQAFRSWLDELRSKIIPHFPAHQTFASAHQMGSVRMGSSPKTSAVDHDGKVWGTEGLYVMDTSVFPSASGVNPMITGMAIAYGLAKKLARKLGAGVEVKLEAKL